MKTIIVAAPLLLSSAAPPAASAWFDSASKPDPYCAKVGVVMDGPTGIVAMLIFQSAALAIQVRNRYSDRLGWSV
jgi:hypothetical protein